MYRKVIKFKDYNGVEREKEYLFNISRAEFIELEYSVKDGFTDYVQRIIKTKNEVELMKIFKKLIGLSYGVKSDDGISFDKSEEETRRFFQSEAYSEFLVELLSSETAASDFINGITPDIPEKQNAQLEAPKVS